VRLKVVMPQRGFENLLLDMHRWLNAEVVRGSYVAHGGGVGSPGLQFVETPICR
jgi:hypothetical protein